MDQKTSILRTQSLQFYDCRRETRTLNELYAEGRELYAEGRHGIIISIILTSKKKNQAHLEKNEISDLHFDIPLPVF